MANPANTTRSAPGPAASAKRLEDGHPSKIAFARDTDVRFWEVEGNPPGLENGDPIDITTMHNTVWKTKAAQSLIEMTPSTWKVAYDPGVISEIRNNLIGQEGSITFEFSDGTDLDFWGYLRSFIPDAHQRGVMPTATVVIEPTNYDPVNRVEAGPVLTEVTGT